MWKKNSCKQGFSFCWGDTIAFFSHSAIWNLALTLQTLVQHFNLTLYPPIYFPVFPAGQLPCKPPSVSSPLVKHQGCSLMPTSYPLTSKWGPGMEALPLFLSLMKTRLTPDSPFTRLIPLWECCRWLCLCKHLFPYRTTIAEHSRLTTAAYFISVRHVRPHSTKNPRFFPCSVRCSGFCSVLRYWPRRTLSASITKGCLTPPNFNENTLIKIRTQMYSLYEMGGSKK